MQNRKGFSLVELLVGLVVASMVSAAIVQVMVVQSRFLSTQEGRSNARSVSQAATSFLMNEIRMVPATGGIVLASRDSIVVRMPFRMGMSCGNVASGTIVAFQPVDSAVYAHATASGNMAGFGWRDGTGTVTWVEASVGMSSGSTNRPTCDAAAMDSMFLNRATLMRMTPTVATAYAGMPVTLHARVKYAFRPSATVPGKRGLWRMIGSTTAEELVAPFDTAAKFRFFWADSVNAKDNPPASLNDIRGIELFMVGVNERVSNPATAESQPIRTAVFLMN